MAFEMRSARVKGSQHHWTEMGSFSPLPNRVGNSCTFINQSIKFYLYSPYSQTTVRLIGL